MTETPTAPVDNHTCAVCGQLDDHPMIHWFAPWERQVDEGKLIVENPSFHFDCLPAEIREQIADDPHHTVTMAAIEAAENGLHGDDLRAFIAEQPSDNEIDEEV